MIENKKQLKITELSLENLRKEIVEFNLYKKTNDLKSEVLAMSVVNGMFSIYEELCQQVWEYENKNVYVKDAIRSESPKFDCSSRDTQRLIHAALGLTDEVGEFSKAVKAIIYYGQPLDKVNLKEELGDLCWYIALAMDVLGTTFEEVQRRNIDKLRVRYPEKFTGEKAVNRDLKKEQEVLRKGDSDGKDGG